MDLTPPSPVSLLPSVSRLAANPLFRVWRDDARGRLAAHRDAAAVRGHSHSHLYVIHHDIKSDNMLLSLSGDIKLSVYHELFS